ncbi:IRK-interacting protein [Olea europaea var. sylvestris]|uniref:IRK-interacting protein n=1 Tax=Olea europaea var. sylvestris TaxID=158386 RepID=UPI000C1CE5F7|nr:IRK-interacting protein [Olea europaea var. sylvestris]
MAASEVFNANENEVSRPDIQAAIAKAVELREIHATLLQGKYSPTNLGFPSASPVSHSRHASQFSAQDYPVFTPSYDDEPLPGYQQVMLENRNYADIWGDCALGGENVDETMLSDCRTTNASLRKGLPSEFAHLEQHICPAEDQYSVTGSCTHHDGVLRSSPGPNYCKSRRKSLGDLKSVSSCKKCMPATVSTETDGSTKSEKKFNIIVPLTDSHALHSQPRNKGLNLSWLFPRLKKKNKNGHSPNRMQSEDVSKIFKDLGMVSVQTLKKELLEANESRDAALMEVAEMKSSLGQLNQKLNYLETYCEELKKALRLAAETKNSQPAEKLWNLSRRGKSIDGNPENLMPVSEEVMIEGFLQIVSETRLSVKQFCKTLVGKIEETDHTLLENLNSLLQPYNMSLNSKYSKSVFYHLEAIINQSLYQDFENCVFQKNGAPKLLDPQQERESHFHSFVALRNLSWNEVVRKGTKYYSEEFSMFCDQKMSSIITTLGWTRPWPEQLLQAFFIAAKCIWLLHLLAFSFSPPLEILRVQENRSFDTHFMEDIFTDRQISQGTSRIKVMVMPGFYVHDRILRCKVLCRYNR